ncbi:class I SAM-dependent methyltransferase [Pelagibacteraceae bacterium]|jgi:hypothetical protein|nr:class I SAM-dependent methyltransferase [Pelagibacteraceae bacterium]|tara:strand:- start:88 stop:771 length:684 start_codon:yes stop_codon:yes gene_type:complete
MNYIQRKIYKINYLFNKVFKENFNQKLDINWSQTSTRYSVINKIIKHKKYKKYLEIGCFQDETFNNISADYKVGVDPVSGGTIRKTSDNFFLDNKDFFDLVFIDGLHRYKQVKKDIFNSLKFINSDGVILLHDCLPLKLRDQMVPRSHEHWNGDTWKAIVEARTFDYIDTYTILADQGIGLIIKRKNRNILKIENNNFIKLKFSDYFNNHKDLMNTVNENEIFSLLD